MTCLYFTVFNYLIFSTKLYSTIFIGLLDLRTQQKIKNNILLSYIYTFNPFHSLEFFLMISSITLWRKTFLFTKLISEPQIRNMSMGGGGNQEEERGKAGGHEPPLFPLPLHILAFFSSCSHEPPLFPLPYHKV